MKQPKNHAFAPLISLQKLSQKSSDLSRLIKLAGSRLSIDELLNQCLPELFKGEFQINSFEQNTLVLTCSSAKLMTRFRFIEEDVINTLNASLAPQQVKHIKIKVRPRLGNPKEKGSVALKHRSLSKKNAQILLEEAEHTEDKKLREVLINLSKHAEQS
jgi:hypothetical protein